MSNVKPFRRTPWIGVGVALGLVASVFAPHAPLYATATDRQANFAIATGAVEQNLEALYFLDFLTGDLKAAVISPVTRRFTMLYEANILGDLGVDVSKGPQYLIVTGEISVRAVGGNVQPSTAAVYVAELTTGNVVAYAVPWSRAAFTSNVPVRGKLALIDKMTFRTIAVRE